MSRHRISEVRALRVGVSGILVVVFIATACALFADPKVVPPTGEKAAAGAADDIDLFEGPEKKHAKPVPARPAAGGEIVAPSGVGPLYADAWPSEYRVVEADLRLTPEGQNRALAMAEFARGLAADAAGDPAKALDAWRQATGLDPGNGDLAVKVARELAKRNEPSEAIRVLKDSVDVAPKNAATRIYLAEVYLRHLNKPDLALATLEQALEVVPEDFGVWALMMQMMEDAGEAKKVDALLEKALASQSKDPDYWIQVGRFLLRAFLKEEGKPDGDARRRMETAFLKAVELRADDASVLAQAGDFYTLIRDEKQALEYYEKAVKLNQPAKDAATKNLREKFIRALANNGRKQEAIPLLENLLRDPVYEAGNSLFEYLGELYEQTGQPEKAIEQYKQSLALDSAEPRNHLNLADAQLRAKKFDDAIATINAARKRFPDQVNVSYALAQVLTRAKRHADALAIFTKIADEAKGRNEAVLDEDFYFQWGAAAEQAKQFDLAEEKLRKCIEIDPELPQAYNYLGYMWVDRGVNLEEGGKFIRKALEIRPNEGAYLDSLGWYYFKSEKYEDAKRELLNAVNALQEEDAVVYDHLADAYDKLGDKKNALKYWERALKLEPDEPEKIQAKIDAAGK